MSVDTSLNPLPVASFGRNQARHLLRRTVFAANEPEVQATEKLGVEQAVDGLLAHLDTDDAWPPPEVDPDVVRPPTGRERRLFAQAKRDGDEKKIHELQRLRLESRRNDQRMIQRMRQWWLQRLTGSPTALRENLVLLWHDHFATRYRDLRDAYLLYQQNELFRASPDRFDTLAKAIVRDPAMLRFLNNDRNNKRKPNENLAREIMELFTLGVGNYTENDIKQGAQALTGYHVDDNEFKFRTYAHDTADKTILQHSGRLNGDSLVNILLDQPSCPRFVAMKLYDHFVLDVADNPLQMPKSSQVVIEQLADLIRQHDYHLRPVLRALLTSRHFYDPGVVGQKVKSPVHLIAGTVRMLNTPERDAELLAHGMRMMGQVLFDPPSVAGWDGGKDWINTSTLFVRQNVTTYLITGKSPTQKKWRRNEFDYDPMPLIEGLSNQAPAAVVDHCVNILIGEHVAAARRASLLAYLNDQSKEINRESLTDLLLLITSMPEYQLT